MQIELDLSVCTVIGNQRQAVQNLLRSLAETADPVAYEAIVVEASDGSVAAAFECADPAVHYFEVGDLSRPAALNHAIRLSKGRYIALLDNDLLVTPGCLKLLVDFMDNHPDVGICGPQILNAYGKTERSARSFHTIFSFIGSTAAGKCIPKILWQDRHYISDWGHQSDREVDWICGGAHVVRREVVEEIGLLEETFDSGFCEMDYYHRSKKRGWHNYYYHTAQVVHPNPSRYDYGLSVRSISSNMLKNAACFFKRKWLG